MAAALRFRSFRKPHLREVKLHGSVAKLGGPAEPPRSSAVQGFRELTSKGETGDIDNKRTSELSNSPSAIKWPQANAERQTEHSI